MNLRKWAVPLTIAGLGAILLSERGRKLVRSMAEHLSSNPGRLAAWDDPARKELDRIQQAVKELEESLGTHRAI